MADFPTAEQLSQRENDANDAASERFEERQRARWAEVALDNRIRNIASREVRTFAAPYINFAVAVVAYRWGGWLPATAVIGIGILFGAWREYRREDRPTPYLVEARAQEIVIQERIVELEAKRATWYRPGVMWDQPVFEPPYWQTVNLKVDVLERMTERARGKAAQMAWRASLPARRRLSSELGASANGIPEWARLQSGER